MKNAEDAYAYTIAALRRGDQNITRSNGGYDLIIEYIVWRYLTEHEGATSRPSAGGGLTPRMIQIAPYFQEAAWELCRKGILRPGVRNLDAYATADGKNGLGFSLTEMGRIRLAGAAHEELAAVLPGRFEQRLSQFASRFGPGFAVRSSQAVKCYNSHIYIACCAMCGAAAESILLAIAVEKMPEAEAVKLYSGGGGRGRLKAKLLGAAREDVRERFDRHFGLLSYWRDDAAHGKPSQLDEPDAFLALLGLLRLAHFVEDEFKP